MNEVVCKTLADHLEQKRAEGLVDIKFYLANTDEAAFDKVCGEVLALYDALEKKGSTALGFMNEAVAA